MTLATNIFKADVFTNRIDELQRKVRPVLASINPNWLQGDDVAVESLRHRVAQRAWFLEQQLRDPESVVLKFDENGVARISQWRPHQGSGGSRPGACGGGRKQAQPLYSRRFWVFAPLRSTRVCDIASLP